MGLPNCYTAGSKHEHCCFTDSSFFTAAATAAAASAVIVGIQSCYLSVIEGITVVVVVTTTFLYFADFTAASTTAKDFATQSFESTIMEFGAIALAGCLLQWRPLF